MRSTPTATCSATRNSPTCPKPPRRAVVSRRSGRVRLLFPSMPPLLTGTRIFVLCALGPCLHGRGPSADDPVARRGPRCRRSDCGGTATHSTPKLKPTEITSARSAIHWPNVRARRFSRARPAQKPPLTCSTRGQADEAARPTRAGGGVLPAVLQRARQLLEASRRPAIRRARSRAQGQGRRCRRRRNSAASPAPTRKWAAHPQGPAKRRTPVQRGDVAKALTILEALVRGRRDPGIRPSPRHGCNSVRRGCPGANSSPALIAYLHVSDLYTGPHAADAGSTPGQRAGLSRPGKTKHRAEDTLNETADRLPPPRPRAAEARQQLQKTHRPSTQTRRRVVESVLAFPIFPALIIPSPSCTRNFYPASPLPPLPLPCSCSRVPPRWRKTASPVPGASPAPAVEQVKPAQAHP